MSPAFDHVAVLVTQAVNVAVCGLVTVHEAALPDPAGPLPEDTAIIVFDRDRHANGREQAFLRPQPENLPLLAATLRQRGTRRLIV